MSNEDHSNDDILAKMGEDGDTDNYFGGEGKADGPGHGHVVATSEGEINYARDSEAAMPGSTPDERVSVDKH